MALRTILEPRWRDWVLHNLGQGGAPASLIADMIREGHESGFARLVVESLARNPDCWPVSGAAGTVDETGGGVVPAGFVAEPSRVAGDNVIPVGDRVVRVVARFDKPDLIALADLLSADECRELIALSAPRIERSTTVDPSTGQATVIANRTSQGAYFHLNETEYIARLDRRIAAVMNWPVENGEGLQIIRYGEGGEYRPHFDYFPPQNAGSERPLSQGGQRIATLIMYLNDVAEGGATIFPELGLSILPRPGQAVYFSYFNSLGQVDPLTLHGGAPVMKGEKWIATKWMRQFRRS